MRYWGRPRNQLSAAVIDAVEGGTKLTVTRIDNHIYFYADVDSDRCLDMIRAIREVDSTLRAEQISRDTEHATPIWLHIQSGGGDLFAGLAISDQLRQIKSPIYSVIEGMCASAATLISLSCTQRFITPNSFMLVHQLSSGVWGTHEQFKDEMGLQQKMMDKMVSLYSQRTNLDETKLREMLQRDFWMDATEAQRLGFVDDVLS